MKLECLICGRMGVVEQRGNSVRIVHYDWVNVKRIFMKHTVKDGNSRMGTMGTEMGTEKAENGIILQMERRR
jgi:hypothetical protein